MGHVVSFRVDGDVVGKGRPRFARTKAGGVATRTPEKTKSYEGKLAYAAQQAMGDGPLIDAPVEVMIRVTVAVPESWPAWKRALALSGGVRPTSKPDSDNVVKIVFDAMNGVVYRDDVQSVDHTFSKRYGERPGLEVTVCEQAALPAQVTKRPAAANQNTARATA